MDTSSDLKIQIGCGSHPNPGYVNCDLDSDWPGVDKLFDACDPNAWPFEPNSAILVEANHCLEHLPHPEGFFEGAWKALKNGGKVKLILPYGISNSHFSDITHVHVWTPVQFCFLQPGYGEKIGNPQHKWKFPFAIDYVMVRVNSDLIRFTHQPWRALGSLRLFNYLYDAYAEMFVQLTALKTEQDVKLFQSMRDPAMAPYSPCVWEHEYNPKKPRKDGEPFELRNFGVFSYELSRHK